MERKRSLPMAFLLTVFAFVVVLKVSEGSSSCVRAIDGVLYSPNFPNVYPKDTDCIWTFAAPPGYRVKLEFYSFELEHHDQCSYDYVALYDGGSDDSPLLGRFCGSNMPPSILSTKHTMLVKFHSDPGQHRKGFRARFTKIDPCSLNPCLNNGICSLQFERTVCSCIDPFAGDRCEKNQCSPNPCENDGTCTVQDAKVNCICKGSSTGNRCEFANGVQAITGAMAAQANLTQYFLNLRESSNSINRWGPQLSRIAMVLYLSDPDFFAPGNRTGEEIAYEVSLQLLSKLALKKKVPTWQLSQFINCLLVSCINPRDFFGVDVVAELRRRVISSNHTNPFAILTLCNAKDPMSLDDVKKVVSAFDAHHRPLWTDTQALSALALTCISSRTNLNVDDRSLTRMIIELKRKQSKNGTIENLKTTALVLQALLASDSYRENFDLGESVKYMMQQLSSRPITTANAYFILPVLNFKSLANINSDHCRIPVRTAIPMELRDDQDDRIQVQYSVFIGDEMEFIRTWRLKVATNYSFYQVMENIGTMEPAYKVEYSMFNGKPYVSGLSKLVDDVEDEMFWFTYTQTLNTTDQQKLLKDSPVDIKVKPDEELILWYRSGSWTDSSKLDRR